MPLRSVEPAATPAALRAVLDGGPAFAPLPPDPVERRQVQRLLATGTAADGQLVVTTSGSTGSPKGVLLTAGAIRASVGASYDRLGGPADWVLCLPVHYVAGLMVLARSILAGSRLVEIPPNLTGLADAVQRLDRPYISLVPAQLRRALARTDLVAALRRCRAVLLGGGPADPVLLAGASGAEVTVVTTYGMSETCGGCVYDGQPLSGVRLDLDGGPLRIAGPMLMSGYWADPARTAATLTDGWFRTQDRAEWVDGRLRVLGRVDDVVVSGGLNVDLAEVERICRNWPGAAGELAVVGLADPERGTRVVAVLERPDRPPGAATAEHAALRTWLADRLPGYAAPRQLMVLPVLPRTAGGKIDRRAVVAALQSPTDIHPRTTR